MKKLIFLFILTVVSVQSAAAQKADKAAVDEVIAQKGANLSLSADKNLLEANETTKLSIKILVYPKPVEGDETPPLIVPTEINLPADNTSPYKAMNWKILQGGGNLIGIDNTTQSYTAPKQAPTGKTMIISVDLMPQRPNLPKVVLLQTLYFVENETAFYLNVPAAGFVNNKYVSTRDSGAKVPTVSPQVAAKLPPDVLKKLEEAQKKTDEQNMDLNLSAMTSNAVAYYDKEKGFTSVRFSKLSIEMANGKAFKSPAQNAIFAFSFDGRGLGTYKLGESQTSSVGFYITAQQKGFGCGDTNSETEKYPCNGSVTINFEDDKIIKGTIRATVFTSVDKKIVSGTLYGKFTANRAN